MLCGLPRGRSPWLPARELAEIRADDLRFSLAEARELLSAAGVELAGSALGLLVDRTEGWAAGLRLAALSLAGHDDPGRFAAEFSGSERTVAEYLLAEVLDRQSEPVRRLLLRTSLLERVNGELADADLMLVSVGRGPLVEGLGLEQAGVEFDRRTGHRHRRAAAHERPAHLRRRRLRRLLAARRTAFREGEVAARNACGHDAAVGNRAVPRPIYTDPEIASVGLTEAEAREQYGDDVATGTFPWIANARAVMQNETAGWVKWIHTTRGGGLLGLVMVGPARNRHG